MAAKLKGHLILINKKSWVTPGFVLMLHGVIKDSALPKETGS